MTLSLFVFVFPSIVLGGGRFSLTFLWLAPVVGAFHFPAYHFGSTGAGDFIVTGYATVVAALLVLAAIFLWNHPKIARWLGWIGGFLAAPIGLIAVYIGFRLDAQASRR